MSQLEDLLQQCTVKLSLPSRMGWGTGFFVAPEWILSCAHVVQEAKGEPVQVQWQKQENWAEAVVERSLFDPYDLALLRVTLPTDAHPCCVYLDVAIQSRDPLYLFGYPDQDFPNGCPVTFNCEGLTGDEPALIKFALGQVRPGMSGAPLLNQRTGKVCGIVKFTRDRSFDLGGGAIPTCVILEQFPQLRELQRKFHQGDRRWSNLVAKWSEIDFEPYLQSILDDEDYREWQDVYIPTTVEDRKRSPQPKFSPRLKLRVETVNPKEEGPETEEKKREQVERWDVLAGLRNYASDHVLLIGKPGSGKSTSLARLLWEEAGNALNTPNAKIPVLVKLRRCTSTIEELIRDFLSRHQLPLDITEIEELLRQGKFLLLLDGLNELPELFSTDIANFRDRYRSTTQMIVSTRELSVGGNLGINKTLKMLPLTEPQMQEFVQGYLGEEGNRLFQQLKGDQLRKFAETPLLLWMLCRVFAENGQVPPNLGLAFREFTQLYDQQIQEDAPADSRDKWSKLLRYLAFALMHDKQPTDFRLSMPKEEAENLLTNCLQQEGRANARDCTERWLKDLLDYHLIQPVIQPNFEEHIEFRHQLIQEYYAAEYLLRILQNLSDEQLKQDYLNYLKWTEPIALMLALVDEKAQALRVVKLALEVDLMLGARLINASKPEWHGDMRNLITALKAPQDIINHILDLTRYVSNNNIFHNFLLQEYNTSEDSIDSLEALRQSLKSPDCDTREYAILELAEKYSTEAIEILEKFIREESVADLRALAIHTLAEIGSIKSISSVAEALDDEDWLVKVCATQAIASWKYAPLIPKLIKMLEDDDEDVQGGAAKALGEIGDELAIQGVLYSLSKADQEYLCADRFQKFQIENRFVVKAIEGLQHAHPDIHKMAIERLKNIGSKEALLESIKDLQTVIESDTRQWISTIEALAKIGSQQAVDVILELLGSGIEDENLQLITVPSIVGRLKLKCAIPILEKLIYGSSANESIADALASLNVVSILQRLVQLWELSGGEQYRPAISAIQNSCKFYNYEIRQATIQNSKLETKNGEQEAGVGQKTTIFNIETINAPNAALNLGGTIHGDQTGTQSH